MNRRRKSVKQGRNILTNTGRAVEIDQRVDPKGYNREYQRLWRKNHPHYYRDRARERSMKKSFKEILEMSAEEHKAVLEELKDK